VHKKSHSVLCKILWANTASLTMHLQAAAGNGAAPALIRGALGYQEVDIDRQLLAMPVGSVLSLTH